MARPRKETREQNERQMPSDEYRSKFYVNPDWLDKENWHYRYVETHCKNAETQSVDNALANGYEPVRASDIPQLAKHAETLASIRGRGAADEYVRIGDQILMRCPIQRFNNLKKAERREAKQQMNRVEWAEQSASIKAPTFVTANEYSRTQGKAFADDEE